MGDHGGRAKSVEHPRQGRHPARGVDRAAQQAGRRFCPPDRMLAALQINFRGGRLPAPENDGRHYSKLTINPSDQKGRRIFSLPAFFVLHLQRLRITRVNTDNFFVCQLTSADLERFRAPALMSRCHSSASASSSSMPSSADGRPAGVNGMRGGAVRHIRSTSSGVSP